MCIHSAVWHHIIRNSLDYWCLHLFLLFVNLDEAYNLCFVPKCLRISHRHLMWFIAGDNFEGG